MRKKVYLALLSFIHCLLTQYHGTSTLYVYGVSNFTKGDLTSYFNKLGYVKNISIPTFEGTRCEYGYIRFHLPNQAEAAYEAGEVQYGRTRKHHIGKKFVLVAYTADRDKDLADVDNESEAGQQIQTVMGIGQPIHTVTGVSQEMESSTEMDQQVQASTGIEQQMHDSSGIGQQMHSSPAMEQQMQASSGMSQQRQSSNEKDKKQRVSRGIKKCIFL